MTHEPGNSSPADPAQSQEPRVGASQDTLRSYIEVHGGAFTDEALTRALADAGHADADIQAALAEYRSARAAGPIRGRAIRAIAIAYVAVYALLSVGMLANSRSPTEFMPSAGGGILILTASLIVTFVISMIWVASRWAFGFLVFLGLTLSSLAGFGAFVGAPQYNSPAVFVPLAIGVLGLIWLIRRRNAGKSGGGVTFEVLLAIPILLLLGVGGACLATGLPIPGAS